VCVCVCNIIVRRPKGFWHRWRPYFLRPILIFRWWLKVGERVEETGVITNHRNRYIYICIGFRMCVAKLYVIVHYVYRVMRCIHSAVNIDFWPRHSKTRGVISVYRMKRLATGQNTWCVSPTQALDGESKRKSRFHTYI